MQIPYYYTMNLINYKINIMNKKSLLFGLSALLIMVCMNLSYTIRGYSFANSSWIGKIWGEGTSSNSNTSTNTSTSSNRPEDERVIAHCQ